MVGSEHTQELVEDGTTLNDRLDRFQLPTLLVGGWYDYYPAEALRMFNGLRGAAGLRNAASSEELRDGHRVVIGPWPHGVSGSTTLGELDFGPNALAENDATNRWLDCLLHDGRPADVLPAATADEMSGRGPGATLVTFPGIGHAPALLDADQIAVVEDWLHG